MKYSIIIFFCFLVNLSIAQENRTENWQSDLQTYQRELESRHIDLYSNISSANFEIELDQIISKVEALTDWEIAVALMQLTRKIGDGHTSVSFANWATNYFPFEVKKISGKWRVTKTTYEYSDLLGSTLVKIENFSMVSVEDQLANVAQFVENRYSKTIRIGEYLPLSELLYALKIIESTSKANFTFVDDQGNVIQRSMVSYPKEQLKQLNYRVLHIGIPEFEKPQTTDFDYLWFTHDAASKTTYIRFDSYPSFEQMIPFAEKLVGSIIQNQTQHLIIDMRFNGGGDLYIGLILANALNMLDQINWKDGVYVLSSAETFSAGTSNVALFRELLNATVVGTPTGSNPTGYQDMDTFDLPNSKLRITYSKRLFRIQEIATEGVQPDIIIDNNWEEYSQGIDSVLKQLMSRISNKK